MIKFLKQRDRKNSGFTLVEVLVAIAIFTISITALMSTLASGISDTTYAKQKMTATYLAQEGIEYIRNMRDDALYSTSTWSSFLTKVTTSCVTANGCSFDDIASSPGATTLSQCISPNTCHLYYYNSGPNIGEYSYTPGGTSSIDSGFTRVITVVSPLITPLNNGDEIKVTSTVSWKEGNTTYHVSFSEDLFNWPIPSHTTSGSSSTS